MTSGDRASVVSLPQRGQTTRVELFVGGAVIANLVAVRLFAARQIGRGHHRFALVYFAPMLFAMIYIVWIAVGLWAISPLAAMGVGTLGVVSLALLVRLVRGMASGAGNPATLGDLPSPAFDYIVWMAIGAPMVLVVALLLLLVTGGLNGTP